MTQGVKEEIQDKVGILDDVTEEVVAKPKRSYKKKKPTKVIKEEIVGVPQKYKNPELRAKMVIKQQNPGATILRVHKERGTVKGMYKMKVKYSITK